MSTLVFMAIGVCVLAFISSRHIDSLNGIRFSIAMVAALAATIGAAMLAIGLFFWVAAEHKADLINRQLGTEYTREDIFFASGYIDEVRELQRQRIELNGDIMKD